jgi:hypothetical protein
MVDWSNKDMWGGIGKAAGGIASLFGGSNDYSGMYGESGDIFKQYMDQAMANSQSHENQGRGDMQQYLQMSQGYGDPYRQGGNSALQSYLGSMGLGGAGARQSALESFQTSPSYQFALNQGLNAQQKNMSAVGGRGSGAEKKALTQYATNLANQEYSQWQQGLAGLTNMGAQANEQAANRAYGTGNNLAQLGLGYSGQQTGMYSDIAQAMAEAKMAEAKAKSEQASQNSSGWGSLFSGAASAIPFFM